MQKAAIALELGGIIGKLEGNADKLGIVVGSASLITQTYGQGDFFGGAQNLIGSVLRNPHIPDFGKELQILLDFNGTNEGKMMAMSLGAIIGGYLLKEIGIHPTLNRIGAFMQKAGVGLAEADILITTIGMAGTFT